MQKRVVERQKLKKISKDQNPAGVLDDDAKAIPKRYFNDESNEIVNGKSEMSVGSDSSNQNANAQNVEQIIVVRKPIVGSLPSFIPIG